MDGAAVLKAFFYCARIYTQCHTLSSKRLVMFLQRAIKF